MTIPDQAHITKIREALWSGLEVGQAALMVGAGFSLNARLEKPSQSQFPTWFTLMGAMIREIVASGGDEESLQNAAQSVSGALRIAEEYVALHGRSNLDNFLRNTIPDQNFQPGDLHDQALKLPWADVFTTNWDTLLERTARRLIDRRYKLVLETTDIPLKSQPRIIKLHGTFPSNGPFILTEEDFRTYPQKFAPFVNMVQQSMTENIFCLVGFSGDDPNFLSWSGWVRDNLGDHAPRLYLVILRGLRQGERKMLESRGIIPIDLSQVFLPSTNVADGDRHQVALSWFFDNLKAGEPPSRIDWPRPADASPSATPGLASIPPYPGDGPLDESFRPR